MIRWISIFSVGLSLIPALSEASLPRHAVSDADLQDAIQTLTHTSPRAPLPSSDVSDHAEAIRRGYDSFNRCTNTLYSDGSSESFAFDAAGNLLSARNATTTNTFAYDLMNRLTSSVSRVAGVAFTNKYRCDVGGLVTNLVYPDGKTVRYDFDADGRVTNVVDWAQRSYRITRDAAGRMTALVYSNGVSGAWQYDASHAVSSWSYSGAAGLPGRSITRDTMGLLGGIGCGTGGNALGMSELRKSLIMRLLEPMAY